MVNEGTKVLDICTTLMGLPDFASDVWPRLFLRNPCFSSDERCVTLQLIASWPSDWVAWITLCVGNFHYSRESYKIFLYALFWLPRINLSLKNQVPYYTISFSWNKRLLEPKFLYHECSVNLCEGNNAFPLMKRHFPLIKFIGTGA